MANTKKYVSLAKLGLYHEKEVARVNGLIEAAKTEVKGYADGLGVKYDAVGSAATVQGKLDEEVTRAKAREDEIAGLVATAQGEVDALETYVGTIPEGATATDIVGYVQEKTTGIASEGAMTELAGRVTTVEGEVATIKGDYLKAADKTELSGLITAEQQRAEGIEGGLRTDVNTILGDYLKAADKTELQGNINTVSEGLAAVKEDVDFFFKDALKDEADVQKYKDTLKELQDYINSDAEAAGEMSASIKQNSDDIDALEGRVGTLEGEMDAVEGRLDTAEGKITALENKFGEGEGSVADMIADAVKVETEAREAAIEEVQKDADQGIADAAVALKAAQDASAHADELNGAMDTRMQAVEGKAHEHSNKVELDKIVEGDKAKWDEAYSKLHEHSNKSVIDGITAEKVSAWDAAEVNAKTYADGLNTAMNTRVEAIETWHADFVECSEEEINALFA